MRLPQGYHAHGIRISETAREKLLTILEKSHTRTKMAKYHGRMDIRIQIRDSENWPRCIFHKYIHVQINIYTYSKICGIDLCGINWYDVVHTLGCIIYANPNTNGPQCQFWLVANVIFEISNWSQRPIANSKFILCFWGRTGRYMYSACYITSEVFGMHSASCDRVLGEGITQFLWWNDVYFNRM